jgi:HD-GYP domain-containing protein (c-di-GMP phosphodiesterase class II)
MIASRELPHAARLREVFADAGIASSAALGVHLAALYGRDGGDGGMFQHARRVASISVFIATSLHIGEPLVGHIERAALLHDIGTLAIPSSLVCMSTNMNWRSKQVAVGRDGVTNPRIRCS